MRGGGSTPRRPMAWRGVAARCAASSSSTAGDTAADQEGAENRGAAGWWRRANCIGAAVAERWPGASVQVRAQGRRKRPGSPNPSRGPTFSVAGEEDQAVRRGEGSRSCGGKQTKWTQCSAAVILDRPRGRVVRQAGTRGSGDPGETLAAGGHLFLSPVKPAGHRRITRGERRRCPAAEVMSHFARGFCPLPLLRLALSLGQDCHCRRHAEIRTPRAIP